ncbi:MAG: helix-turn-helix transcriptional regulator [Lachnospiraceae bacterium]|nr:helix-turn-helix transcriptional regulator [Lachnospiraceae bacterium]
MIPTSQDLNIYVRDDLYETKQHGTPDYPLALYHVDSQNMYLELVYWHWHEEFEYIVVTGGTAHFLVGDQDFILSSGDCLLINQNVIHRVKPYNDCDCTYYSVVFHPSLFLDVNNPVVRSKYLDPVSNSPYLKYYLLKPDNPDAVPFIQLLQKIISINEQCDFGYELTTKALLCELWISTLRSALRRIDSSPHAENTQTILDEDRVKKILTYIATHYMEQISLEDIASSVHISKSECCRCFKRRLHVTPFEYLIKYRIYSAAIMIVQCTGRISFSDIAIKTGFNSSSYFNKMFRKYIGSTPTQFRKIVGGNLLNIQKVLEGHIHLQDAMIISDLIAKETPDLPL